MAARVVSWNAEEAKRELAKRLAYAREARKDVEKEWKENERVLFGSSGLDATVDVSSRGQPDEGMSWDASRTRERLDVNYAFRDYRFIHSQLAANPPAVLPRPASNDPSDRRKADAADRLVRYALRQYALQERIDLCSANCLAAGTGIIKTVQDAEAGDIVEFDPETGEVLMEGDISVTVPSYWDIFPDPDATLPEEIKWVFERIYMPYEEACFRFPDKKELLKNFRIQQSDNDEADERNEHPKRYDVVEVYQYWERGLPYNGMLGRFGFCTREGDPLTALTANPFSFSRPKDRGLGMPSIPEEVTASRKMPEKAELPYHWFTDVDVPGRLWGRSTLFYSAPLQNLHNSMVNVLVDVLEAHGVPRLVLSGGADISDESVTNTPWDVVKIDGQGDIKFQDPMPMPAAFGDLLRLVQNGVSEMSGVNESQLGRQSREQSGFSMQLATQNGNMIRKRLFNKYVRLVESIYKAFLNLVRKHWDTGRTILVLGKEKAYEAADIKGADIDGGFDLVVEYGASLSLDPMSRREEIMQLMPLFKEAGIDTRSLLTLMKLNELDAMYDKTQLSGDRQREIFEEMLSSGQYIPPRQMSDHAGMLDYGYNYIMTSEFKYLNDDQKALIEQHIQEREAFAAQQKAVGPQPAPGGAAPAAPDTQLPGPGALGAAQPPGQPMANG